MVGDGGAAWQGWSPLGLFWLLTDTKTDCHDGARKIGDWSGDRVAYVGDFDGDSENQAVIRREFVDVTIKTLQDIAVGYPDQRIWLLQSIVGLIDRDGNVVVDCGERKAVREPGIERRL